MFPMRSGGVTCVPFFFASFIAFSIIDRIAGSSASNSFVCRLCDVRHLICRFNCFRLIISASLVSASRNIWFLCHTDTNGRVAAASTIHANTTTKNDLISAPSVIQAAANPIIRHTRKHAITIGKFDDLFMLLPSYVCNDYLVSAQTLVCP